jgi:hypothetical protein
MEHFQSSIILSAARITFFLQAGFIPGAISGSNFTGSNRQEQYQERHQDCYRCISSSITKEHFLSIIPIRKDISK